MFSPAYYQIGFLQVLSISPTIPKNEGFIIVHVENVENLLSHVKFGCLGGIFWPEFFSQKYQSGAGRIIWKLSRSILNDSSERCPDSTACSLLRILAGNSSDPACCGT